MMSPGRLPERSSPALRPLRSRRTVGARCQQSCCRHQHPTSGRSSRLLQAPRCVSEIHLTSFVRIFIPSLLIICCIIRICGCLSFGLNLKNAVQQKTSTCVTDYIRGRKTECQNGIFVIWEHAFHCGCYGSLRLLYTFPFCASVRGSMQPLHIHTLCVCLCVCLCLCAHVNVLVSFTSYSVSRSSTNLTTKRVMNHMLACCKRHVFCVNTVSCCWLVSDYWTAQWSGLPQLTVNGDDAGQYECMYHCYVFKGAFLPWDHFLDSPINVNALPWDCSTHIPSAFEMAVSGDVYYYCYWWLYAVRF